MNFNQDYRSGIAALLANPDIIASIQRHESTSDNATAISIAASVAEDTIADLSSTLAIFARIVQEWQQSPREKLTSSEQALNALSVFAEMAGETIMETNHIASAASVAEYLRKSRHEQS